MIEKVVLAIDPGSSKCGIALVRRTADQQIEIIAHEVVPTESLISKLQSPSYAGKFQLIIVGGGTTSKNVVRAIREKLGSVGTLVVDETDTTMQARERYWENNPRRGWRRLWPATLQVPPEPVDDFVAVILAERVLLAG